jgi:hypothetical protein
MCGPKFCSMNISASVEQFTPGEAEAALENEGGRSPGAG